MKNKFEYKLIVIIILIIIAFSGILIVNLTDNNMEKYQNNENDIIYDIKSAYDSWDPQITRTVGKGPAGLFIGDANNDGFNDIVTANFDSDNISIILWNNTIGDWNPNVTRSAGNGPVSIFIGDANNDNYNDIVTANLNSNNISIFLWNNVSECWNPQITRSVGDSPWDIEIGDTNNDGFNDILTANMDSNNISIFLWNNNTEDWDTEMTKSTGISPMYLSLEDANNDGYNDIAISNMDSDNVSIFLWDNNLKEWEAEITKAVGEKPYDIEIGDVNNDGYNDIITANSADDNISIFLWNNVSDDWNPQITKDVGNIPWGIDIGDANNDGFNDIIIINTVDYNVSILLWNNNSKNWEPQITKSGGIIPFDIKMGDVNNNGYNDIVVTNFDSNNISIILWKPPTISIINPDNQTHDSPLKGFYPATYGFDNDEGGSKPEDWEGQGIVEISHMGHNKTLKHTAYSWSGRIMNSFDNQTSGTIEFYINTDNVYGDVQINCFGIGEGTRALKLGIGNGRFRRHYNTAWHSLDSDTSCSADTWYHVRIDFDCNTDTFNTSINNELKSWDDPFDGGDYDFINDIRIYQFSGSPTTHFDAFGFSWDPSYNIDDNLNMGMELSYENNTNLEWISYSLDGQDNITIFEREIMPIPQDGAHWIQLFAEDSESGELIKSEARRFIVDLNAPQIIIHSPKINESYGCIAPTFNISIIEPYLDSKWYTIDDGLTNYTFHNLSGSINQSAWCKLPLGELNISFYAKDTLNRKSCQNVNIIKGKFLNIEITKHSFSSSEFMIEFLVFNDTKDFIDFATVQMWWNGEDVSTDVINKGNGYYTVALDPLTVESGEDPILLNMTISASGYRDKYFETNIVVNPSIEDILQMEIVDQSYYQGGFNMSFIIYNRTNTEINFATIHMWWNGVNVTDDVQNHGGGIYTVNLNPITVIPGEDPLLLNMTVSAEGYEDLYFEKYIAVDPILEDKLNMKIIEQTFSTKEFNISLIIQNSTGFAIIPSSVQIWWDGVDVSSDIQIYGNGNCFISLNPLTIEPGEEPILLNMTISADGFEDEYFETYIAVDPASLLKGQAESPNLLGIILVISSIGVGAIIAVLSFYILRRRKTEF